MSRNQAVSGLPGEEAQPAGQTRDSVQPRVKGVCGAGEEKVQSMSFEAGLGGAVFARRKTRLAPAADRVQDRMRSNDAGWTGERSTALSRVDGRDGVTPTRARKLSSRGIVGESADATRWDSMGVRCEEGQHSLLDRTNTQSDTVWTGERTGK